MKNNFSISWITILIFQDFLYIKNLKIVSIDTETD
jgi:hypothetical protein